jgi:hypothetical protein
MFAMMQARPMEGTYSETLHEDAHSLEASIEDFEEQERRSPLFPGFKPERAESEADDTSSAGLPWSPPGFKSRNSNASNWFRQDPYGKYDLRPSVSPSRSRQTSPEVYQDAVEGDPDITIAVNTPLPTGTDSPVRERSPEVEPLYGAKTSDFNREEPIAPESPNNCNDSPWHSVCGLTDSGVQIFAYSFAPKYNTGSLLCRFSTSCKENSTR